MKISVVVPVYNSEKSLTELYQRLIKVLAKEAKAFELVFVDDCSIDDSFAILKKLHAEDERVKIIRLANNHGQQQALFCGFQYITGDLAITIDDDLQHPPEEIPLLLHEIERGYDVVFGVPITRKHPLYRNFGSLAMGWVLDLICRKPREVKISSFRVLRANVIREICQTKHSFIYLAPLIFLATSKVANVNVRHEARKFGRSGYNLFKLMKLAVKLIVCYSFIGKLIPCQHQPRFKIAERILE
jgi:undecaprenyl-phosphate 4-deoxy-4-formamido-L-arabinose transferase